MKLMRLSTEPVSDQGTHPTFLGAPWALMALWNQWLPASIETLGQSVWKGKGLTIFPGTDGEAEGGWGRKGPLRRRAEDTVIRQ